MKIIFLDIDGVMNPGTVASLMNMGDGVFLLPEHIGVLNQIISECGLETGVVVTSTHRYGRSVEELNDMFKKAGFNGTVVGKTPESGFRDEEIKAFLDDNIGISSFVIIDDMRSMGKLPNFVRTPDGLREEYVPKIVKILSQPAPAC